MTTRRACEPGHAFILFGQLARLAALTLVLWIGGPRASSADVLTFDTLPGNETEISNGYGGLNWDNFYSLIGSVFYPGSGYEHGTVSGTVVGFNGFGNPATVSAVSGTFTFHGAYLTAAWTDSLQVQVDGLVSGLPVFTQTVAVDTTRPRWFTFNYPNIEALRFTTFDPTFSGATHLAMDDFKFNCSGPDGDGDGIPDECDICPAVADAGQTDTDRSGVGDACNDAQDADGDEWEDGLDNCPAVANPGQEDADHDHVGDACNDADDADGDEFADLFDNCPATPNPTQQDSDSDGIGDACDPCVGFGATDTDGDGRCDADDNCPTVANPTQEDLDFDGFGDACDTCNGPGPDDVDGDGVCVLVDNCPTVANPGQQDTDFNGVGDACNDAEDTDGDEWADSHDNCPTVANPGQQDTDFNGIGDACNDAEDSDGDEFADYLDNCPTVSNPTQINSDGDDFGDACDGCDGYGIADADGDTVCDGDDNCPTVPNPDRHDANGDGIGDACSPQVSVDSVATSGSNLTATVIVTSPVGLPLSGTIAICDDTLDVTAVSFTWLATSCNGQDTFELTINGTTVATIPGDPVGLSCSCTPPIGTYTVPLSTALPLLVPGVNRLGVRKSTGVPFHQYTGLSWAYATLTTSDGPQRVEIFDAGGGPSYDNPDLCSSSLTFDAVDRQAETLSLCDQLVSQSWSGTLPCSLDVAGLTDQSYALVVTATDGVVGSPSTDATTFTHAGEATLFINTTCELACDDMTDQCIATCPPVPRGGCKTAGKSILIRKKSSDGSKDKLLWKWLKGEATTLEDFGDPTDTADYVLCMYGGASPALLSGGQLLVPKSSNWSPLGTTGWSYDNSAAAPNGAQKLSLKSSSANKSKAKLKGAGVSLPDPAMPVAPGSFPLVVQLLNGETSTCLESTFTSGDVLKNDEGNLKAKK